MIHDLGISLDLVPDLRHRVQRLTWFKESFHTIARELGTRYGFVFSVDDRRLASAFLDWAEAFAHERHRSEIDPIAFVVYSGGLMLKQLIEVMPVTPTPALVPKAKTDSLAEIAEFWPEGFLYVCFCMMIVSSILKRDFAETVSVTPNFEDLRTWQSFRENVQAHPSLALPFFDFFLGGRPNWTFPESLPSRSSADVRISLALHEPQHP